MSRYDRDHSRHQTHNSSRYKVIFDSNQGSSHRKNSRSRSRGRSPSPLLLQAIVDGHISENLEVINKNYKKTVESFKVIPEHVRDPYDFTILPVLTPANDVSELVESARKLRRESKIVNFGLSDARLNLMLATLKSHECDAKLSAIKAQLTFYSKAP